MSLGRMEMNTFRKAEKITKITHISCKHTQKITPKIMIPIH